MKKIIFTLIVLMFSINTAYAENTLSFSEDKKELIYETELLDKDTFINHQDMMPGEQYKDTLNIVNNTDNICKLYLKATEVDQSNQANDLLTNILMTVYLDEKVIYDGTASGIEYDNVSLLNSIYLGEYKKGDKNVLNVSTMLSSKFTNKNNTEISKIKWEFYAQCGEGKDVSIINPDTGDKVFQTLKNIMICSVIILVIISIATIYNKSKEVKR